MAIQIKKSVQDSLQQHKSLWPQISEAVDIPLNSLIKIGRGVWVNPGVDHIETLYNYLIEDRMVTGGFDDLLFNAGKAS